MRKSSSLAKVMSLLGGFIAVAMTMGLLLAGLALPAVGVAGQATNSSIKMFNQIPGNFEMNPLAQQSKILASDGSVIGTPYNQNRIVVPLNQIAPIMRIAQVSIEDERFYEHGGVDPRGLLRAISSNVMSGGTQGASTLTQQYVKVAMQNQALNSGNQSAAAEAVSRSGMQGYVRKLQQLKYSVTLEQHYSKDQILDGYLNLVYFGDQQYGIEAAARHYFGKHASQLNLQESALLAGVVNAPGVTDPINNPDAAVKRRNVVLYKMHQQGKITNAEYTAAAGSKLQLKVTSVSNSCATSRYPYFCYYVNDWLMSQPALGKTRKEREGKLKSGGLTIQTSFDPRLASIIDKEIKAKVPVGNSADVQSAGVIIQPGTGLVLASGQNTTFSAVGGTGKSAFDYTTGSSGNNGFAYGSTAKAFAVVAAFESGMKLDSKITLPKMQRKPDGTQYYVYSHNEFPGDCGLGRSEKWSVNNDFPVAADPMPLNQAAAESVNTAFGSLVSQVGACKVRDIATKFGLQNGSGRPIGKTPSDITLGTSDVTPMSLANAYATLAAQGKYCEPRPVKSIKDSSGKALDLKLPACKQVVTKDVANATTKVLESVLGPDPLATAKNAVLADGRPAAGKTGTITGAIQTWFVGYTPQLAAAIWVGHVNSQKPLKDVTLGKTSYKGYIFGGTLAAPIWKSVMDQALKGQPKLNFPAPSSALTQGEQVTVPNVTGQSQGNAKSLLESAGFTVSMGAPQPSRMYRGLVAFTNPTAGSSATKGSAVIIYPSTGSAAATTTQPPATTQAGPTG
ncbi:transglycosylase domain-containing protein [Calidifontibacter terrae]